MQNQRMFLPVNLLGTPVVDVPCSARSWTAPIRNLQYRAARGCLRVLIVLRQLCSRLLLSILVLMALTGALQSYLVLRTVPHHDAFFNSTSEMVNQEYVLQLALVFKWLLLALLGLSVARVLLYFLYRGQSQRVFAAMLKFAKYSKSAARDYQQLGTAANDHARQLIGKVEELTHRDSVRRELVADVSHDLLKPLASIRAYAETISRKAPTLAAGDIDSYVSVILRNADSMDTLISAFLELSNLEGTDVRLNRTGFCLKELVQDIRIASLPKANAVGVELSIAACQNVPNVYADPALIQRVLVNLVENAIQYTPENGQVEIRLQVVHGAVLVSVVDSGIGIAENEIEVIFDALYRGQDTRVREQKGHGLGLAICKKILDLHESGLFVQSVRDQGTSIAFNLEIATASY